MRCMPGSRLFAPMLPPQLVGIMLQLSLLQQQFVVAVPLDEIGATHEGAMFAGAPVIVPQVEVGEIDGMGEGWTGQCSIFVETVHDGLGCKYLLVGACEDEFSLRVDAIDCCLGVALRADLLHVDLGLEVIGPFCAYLGGEIPAKAV